MNDPKCGTVGKGLRRRILALGLTIAILLTVTLSLHSLSDWDFLDVARAQEDSVSALPTGSDTLAEWHVFLVATNNYYDPDDPRLSRLRYAEADVDSLEKIFKALGVKDENITVLKSSNPDYFASTSKESIENGYQRFLNGLTEESIAFVFLSGHGFVGKGTTRSYYLPKDCTVENREEKKISIDNMMANLAASKARFKWMCVDACRNEIGKRGFGERGLAIDDVPKGILLTQSCSSGQFSYEVGESEGAPSDNGVFTRVFVNAISGRDPSADADQDGRVTLLELRDYVCKQVPFDAEKYCYGAKQNPVFTSFDGASFEDFAMYPLFEDRDWREALRLREDAEKLVQQENYAEALKRIQEAFRLRPKDPGIASLKDEIEKLFNEHDVNQKAETAYKDAQEALNAKMYGEARKLIGEALRLKPDDSTYDVFRKLIDTQEKLDAKQPEKPEKPEVVVDKPKKPSPSTTELKAGTLKSVTIAGIETRFRWCPPGEFMMGSTEKEEGRFGDELRHKVKLTEGFWLCEIPVTVMAFRKFVDDTGYKTDAEKDNDKYTWKTPGFEEYSFSQTSDHPVVRVSWNDVQAYVDWINKRYAPSGQIFRLPSEAHWEYACRAGSETAYWWGSNPEDGEGKANVADASAEKEFPDWSCFSFDDGFTSTSPVGSFQSSPWGLKDIVGNVWEWCSDWYGDYPADMVTDPEGPTDGLLRVFRGSAWSGEPMRCRSADREGYAPENRNGNLGFRLELSDVK